MSVSYTHLDVYKRQATHSTKIYPTSMLRNSDFYYVDLFSPSKIYYGVKMVIHITKTVQNRIIGTYRTNVLGEIGRTKHTTDQNN